MKEPRLRASLAVEELGPYMLDWQQTRPGLVNVETVGQSGGYPIYAAVFTDKAVPDEDKQTALIVAQHSGMEISGLNTALSVGNYLLSDRESAADILQTHTVVLVPCPNPYSFAKQDRAYQFKNEAGIDEYTAFDYHGAKKNVGNPSAQAIQTLIDRFKPELLLDLHGVWNENQLVRPTLGVSAFASNRLYNARLMDEIQKSAVDAGFAAFRGDLDEHLVCGDRTLDDPALLARFTPSAPGAVASTYAYTHYHTLAASLEIAWESEGVVRVIAALKAGTRLHRGETVPGYPTRSVFGPYGHASLRAYGKTAVSRRESRTELWQHTEDIVFGVAHPEMPGLAACFYSTDASLTGRIFGSYYTPVRTVTDRMRTLPYVDADALAAVFDASYPAFLEGNIRPHKTFTPQHGLTVRVGLPFADASVKTVLCNGHLLSQSDYTVTDCDHIRYVDIPLAPGKCPPLAILAVTYDCTLPPHGILTY